VSNGDNQSTAAQLKALRAAGCGRIFDENGSGGRWDRTKLQRMLDHMRKRDVVVVWKLDRLSRTLKDFRIILEKNAQGCGPSRDDCGRIGQAIAAVQCASTIIVANAFGDFLAPALQESSTDDVGVLGRSRP
jgi:hypothetical protein